MSQKSSPVFRIEKGEQVLCEGREYVILRVLDLSTVLVRNLDTKETKVLEIRHLVPWCAQTQDIEKKDIDLAEVKEEHWDVAKHRLELIQPLLVRRERGAAIANKLAATAGIGISTLYKMRDNYISSGALLSSLLPTKHSGGQGHGRISKEIEAVIVSVLDNFYFTDQRPSIQAAFDEICRLCDNAGLSKPNWRTVKRRIQWRGEREGIIKRYGRRVAEQILEPNEGVIPNADWPLAMCQIDHTPVPVIIVHDVNRRSIKSPWVTLAIDVDSRVVLGMYLSLEAPSAMSAGMCLSHAILPKEKWLADDVGLPEVEWPCWGVMGILHMDNAPEFRGNTIRAACLEYKIDPQFRPVKRPQYGAHIERLMGTFSKKIETVEGATFSSPEKKGEYDSEGRAIMSFHDLEQWLVNAIAKYHVTPHGGINDERPLERYRKGLLGGGGRLPRGLPARRLDEEKVRIDFMPIVERTVQSYGVVIDDFYYFADVLRPWVNAPDPDNQKLKRMFNFRRDPHDISRLFFFDPNTQRYYSIPMRNSELGPISLWEARAGRKAAKEAGVTEINERLVYEYANKQKEIETKAAEITKAARREDQRRRNHAKQREKRKRDLPETLKTEAPAMPPEVRGYDPTLNSSYEDDDE